MKKKIVEDKLLTQPKEIQSNAWYNYYRDCLLQRYFNEEKLYITVSLGMVYGCRSIKHLL